MNELTIVLPYLPVRELSPNASRRCPEGLKIKLRQELKEIAYYCIIDARNRWEKTEHREWKTLEKAKLFYTFVFPVKRQHDADNLISAMKVAQDFQKNGRITAAICAGPSILANAGILIGKTVTGTPSQEENIKNRGGEYTGMPVEVDGQIITAKGPDAAEEFGEKIAYLLED